MGNLLKHHNYKHSRMKFLAATLLVAATQAVSLGWDPQPIEHEHSFVGPVTRTEYRTESQARTRLVPKTITESYYVTEYMNDHEVEYETRYRTEHVTKTRDVETEVWRHGVRNVEETRYFDQDVTAYETETRTREV